MEPVCPRGRPSIGTSPRGGETRWDWRESNPHGPKAASPSSWCVYHSATIPCGHLNLPGRRGQESNLRDAHHVRRLSKTVHGSQRMTASPLLLTQGGDGWTRTNMIACRLVASAPLPEDREASAEAGAVLLILRQLPKPFGYIPVKPEPFPLAWNSDLAEAMGIEPMRPFRDGHLSRVLGTPTPLTSIVKPPPCPIGYVSREAPVRPPPSSGRARPAPRGKRQGEAPVQRAYRAGASGVRESRTLTGRSPAGSEPTASTIPP